MQCTFQLRTTLHTPHAAHASRPTLHTPHIAHTSSDPLPCTAGLEFEVEARPLRLRQKGRLHLCVMWVGLCVGAGVLRCVLCVYVVWCVCVCVCCVRLYVLCVLCVCVLCARALAARERVLCVLNVVCVLCCVSFICLCVCARECVREGHLFACAHSRESVSGVCARACLL